MAKYVRLTEFQESPDENLFLFPPRTAIDRTLGGLESARMTRYRRANTKPTGLPTIKNKQLKVAGKLDLMQPPLSALSVMFGRLLSCYV